MTDQTPPPQTPADVVPPGRRVKGALGMPERPWYRHRGMVLATAAAMAVILGGATTGAVLITDATHQAALTDARDGVHELAMAEIRNRAAVLGLLEDLDAASALHTAVTVLSVDAAGYVDGDALTGVAVPLAGVLAVLEGHGDVDADAGFVPTFEVVPATEVSRVFTEDMSAAQIEADRKKVGAAATGLDEDTAVMHERTGTVAARVADLEAALGQVAGTVPAAAAAIAAAAPSAGQAEQDALTVTVAQIAETLNSHPIHRPVQKPLTGPLTGYVTAANAVQASHTAVEEQRAAEAAAAAEQAALASGATTYTDPKTGQTRPTTPNGGSNPGSGSNPGGGGSNPGGGGGEEAAPRRTRGRKRTRRSPRGTGPTTSTATVA